ncbi:YjbF family lipoprotein [Halomonas sp. MCCC 1A17488]|uniref:YjbF family lipoprotein n=1 Tax=unclassified Halomonas TaxID=2609666 RepID=UPI0018D23927|nr:MULTISPECIES: YjbF family lipoprotein [unclassified Halomonas]MCE8015048.1 YjbF family lipoprotein [Halomonas sp. MCCC 1A17488]MCG3238381.1 YjbF family lipoprotein [Halomonas sp. MCCC 1A17488]QPP47875.1 YjbF family lipoprotein [Halomonas sp. SS10-MC5]
MSRDRRYSIRRVPTQGRRKAVLLRLLLAGGLVAGMTACAQGGRLTPMGATLMGGARGEDPAAQAEALPYATLVARTEGNQALLVMAHRTGHNGRDTYWQAGDRATLQLRDGVPASTAGFDALLLGRWLTAEPGHGHYRVHVHWRDADGQEWQDMATASLTCEAAQPVDLPLTRLTLERCTERLDWQGSNTHSRGVYWREPGSLRIWGGDMALWPDGPRLRWQVARPWWSDAEDTGHDDGQTSLPDAVPSS